MFLQKKKHMIRIKLDSQGQNNHFLHKNYKFSSKNTKSFLIIQYLVENLNFDISIGWDHLDRREPTMIIEIF